MTITRSQVERMLIRRCGKLLTAADLDGETFNGTNEDLNDPIGCALRQCGYGVSDIASVENVDLAAVTDDRIDQLLDLAELRTLENIEGNYDDVDISATERSESLNQLLKQVQAKIERLREKVKQQYGIGLGELGSGVLTLDFAEIDDESSE